MKKIKNTFLKLLLKLLLILFSFIAVTFVVYFFNLDMKLMRSVVLPFMDKYFDKQQPQRII